MIDKYQQIIDEENLILKHKLAEIDRKAKKTFWKIVSIGGIIILLWCYICFY